MFFTFRDNMFYSRGFAFIDKIIEPSLKDTANLQYSRCPICGTRYGDQLKQYYDRETVVQLKKTRAHQWPDIISNNQQFAFITVSQRVLEAWEAEGIGTFPCFPVRIQPPFPQTLTTEPPPYYRLDYKKMAKAEMDFEVSGFPDARTCEICGSFLHDSLKTMPLQRTKIFPRVFKPETWDGSHVFRLTPSGYMFCTDNVVECAHKYKLTNFLFIPAEIGSGAGFRGVDYLKKNWRLKLSEQIRKFEEHFYGHLPSPPGFNNK